MTSTVIISALIAAVGATADISVNVTLEPPVIPFHRQAKFTISVEAPRDYEVKLPDMMEKFGGLNIYDTPAFSQEPVGDDRVRYEETYTLDPVLVGDYVVEPVTVRWNQTESVTVPSPAVRVRALTPEEEEAAMQFETAIAEPYLERPSPVRSWALWVAALVTAAALVAAYLYWRRRKQPEFAPEERISAWDLAYRRLRELDERRLPEQGKYEPYYVDLSWILRYYVEERFHLHAPEHTTPEFLAEASESGLLTDDQQRRIATFLRHCDLVKFAQHKPAVHEMEESFTIVLQFVDETAPKAPEPEEEAA